MSIPRKSRNVGPFEEVVFQTTSEEEVVECLHNEAIAHLDHPSYALSIRAMQAIMPGLRSWVMAERERGTSPKEIMESVPYLTVSMLGTLAMNLVPSEAHADAMEFFRDAVQIHLNRIIEGKEAA